MTVEPQRMCCVLGCTRPAEWGLVGASRPSDMLTECCTEHLGLMLESEPDNYVEVWRLQPLTPEEIDRMDGANAPVVAPTAGGVCAVCGRPLAGRASGAHPEICVDCSH